MENNQNAINAGMTTQSFIQSQQWFARQKYSQEQRFREKSLINRYNLDMIEYKEQHRREAQLATLYIGQHPDTYPPVLDFDRAKNYYPKNKKRLKLELKLAKLSQKLRQIEIESLSDLEIENYNNTIIQLFNNIISLDFEKVIHQTDPDILQPKNFLIQEHVLNKRKMNSTKYDEIKNVPKERKLDVILGPINTNTWRGRTLILSQKEKRIYKILFKDDPMQLGGKLFEPFGPFAWKYGIFRAMTQLKAYESVTWKGNDHSAKFFQGKDYADQKNFENKMNLLKLVRERGHLLAVKFPELEEMGQTMLGLFIELAVRTINVQAPKDQFLLFESYNIFGLFDNFVRPVKTGFDSSPISTNNTGFRNNTSFNTKHSEANIENYRKANLEFDKHFFQHQSIFIPPIAVNSYKRRDPRSSDRHFGEDAINELYNELKLTDINSLSSEEINKYNKTIQSVFTRTIMSDFAKNIANAGQVDLYQQQANKIIREQVLQKALQGTLNPGFEQIYEKIKQMTNEQQLEFLFGPPGSNGGAIKVDQPFMAEMLKVHFKDNPLQMISKQYEPFGPHAWRYGMFRAMYYLEAFKNLTFNIEGKNVKIFENKTYSDPKNFTDERNLLRLVKDYGPMLVREYREFHGKGESIIGYFIDLSAKSRNIGSGTERYFLFESYNIFE